MSNSRCLRQLTKDELRGLIQVATERKRPRTARFLDGAMDRLYPPVAVDCRSPKPYHPTTVNSHKRQQQQQQQQQQVRGW